VRRFDGVPQSLEEYGKIRVRLNRRRLGNFAEVKPVGGGVSEVVII
jgi:putative component of toxin-antitoxin plasmid stabilization module